MAKRVAAIKISTAAISFWATDELFSRECHIKPAANSSATYNVTLRDEVEQ